MKKRCMSIITIVSFLFIMVEVCSGAKLELPYSSFLGGAGDDCGYSVAIDPSRAIYITGSTTSIDFPTANSYQPSSSGMRDVVIVKLSSTGSNLVYSTYLGGANDEIGYGIALNQATAYITGYTTSNDFPTEDPYQPSYSGNFDTFISRLSSDGTGLIFSTYLGGTNYDSGRAISIENGTLYITGTTLSSDFPTENPYQASFAGIQDAFVSRLSSTGSELLYSSYLGGSDMETGYGLAVENGNTYAIGETGSGDFPTANPYQDSFAGVKDVFVSKFSSSGSKLIYSTYLGGSSADQGNGITVEDGCAYITGRTLFSGFPTVNSYQATGGGSYDVFVSKLATSGSRLVYSTYLGGLNTDAADGIAVEDGCTYVTGYTGSNIFPTINSYQSTREGGADMVFVSRFSSSGSNLIYSTYLGGGVNSHGCSIAVREGAAYITGYTGSTDFPTSNPYQAVFGGGSNDAFICRLEQPSILKRWSYDYNGDGTSDIAIFRGSSGLWAIRGITRVYYGAPGDWTAPADYDGDGTTEMGIFRPSNGLWAVRKTTRVYFGNNYDHPYPGDYNGDGTAEIGIFRITSGLWCIRNLTRIYFGSGSDSPAPGYYDERNDLDIAVFRPDTGLWAVRGLSRIYFGGINDFPIPGDYNGDGFFEAAVFRPSSGLWAVRGVTRTYFGTLGDSPVPADYSGDLHSLIGIYRSNNGLWAITGRTRIYFGTSGDRSVTR